MKTSNSLPPGLPNILYTVLFFCSIFSSASAGSEAETLIKFRNSLSNSTALSNWDPKVNLCSWNGIICTPKEIFFGLHLENMGLQGIIDVETLAELPGLRTISFMNNKFEGPFPDIHKLGPLRGFYLSNNYFSGEIPDDAFSGFSQMRRVFLANNMFTGNIPKSLGDLPTLVEVQLQDNQFEGNIPAGLSNQNPNAFARNGKLCGKPLQPCKSSK